jgi:hypothetical protein
VIATQTLQTEEEICSCVDYSHFVTTMPPYAMKFPVGINIALDHGFCNPYFGDLVRRGPNLALHEVIGHLPSSHQILFFAH